MGDVYKRSGTWLQQTLCIALGGVLGDRVQYKTGTQREGYLTCPTRESFEGTRQRQLTDHHNNHFHFMWKPIFKLEDLVFCTHYMFLSWASSKS